MHQENDNNTDFFDYLQKKEKNVIRFGKNKEKTKF
jgi:hypothetical protein